MKLRIAALLIFVVAAVAPTAMPSTALASHREPPWTGGASVLTSTEQSISAVTTYLAGKSSYGHCPTPDEWLAFARGYEFNPNATYAFVPVFSGTPANYALYHPAVCLALDHFITEPVRAGQKLCQVGTRTEYRTEIRTEYRTELRTENRTEYRKVRYRVKVMKRVKVRGKWRTKRVLVWRTRSVQVVVPVQVQVQVPHAVTVQVPYEVAIMEQCKTYAFAVESIATVAHESMHVRGIRSEPVAECFGLQLTAPAASRFGAATEFAYEIGDDYLPIHRQFVSSSPDYYTRDCYDGGALDLWPTVTGWPTPRGLSLRAEAAAGSVPLPAGVPTATSGGIGIRAHVRPAHAGSDLPILGD
jgi:hypothetical protein